MAYCRCGENDGEDDIGGEIGVVVIELEALPLRFLASHDPSLNGS